MMIGELSRICSISSVLLFLKINFTQIEASVTLVAFSFFLISQFLENDIFSIEMDSWM